MTHCMSCGSTLAGWSKATCALSLSEYQSAYIRAQVLKIARCMLVVHSGTMPGIAEQPRHKMHTPMHGWMLSPKPENSCYTCS